MTICYLITDPGGTVHEARSAEAYEQIVEELRERFGVECELIVRAELQKIVEDTAPRVA